jgi:hypothetical protein
MARPPECEKPLVSFGMCKKQIATWISPSQQQSLEHCPKIVRIIKMKLGFWSTLEKIIVQKIVKSSKQASKQKWLSRRLESPVEQKGKLCSRIEHWSSILIWRFLKSSLISSQISVCVCVCYIANYKLNLAISLEWTFRHQVSWVISLMMVSSILQIW